MSKPLRTCSIPELIDLATAKGIIAPPFTDAERALARAVSKAYYFANEVQEMPTRLEEGICWYVRWGIAKVLHRREGEPTSPATKN